MASIPGVPGLGITSSAIGDVRPRPSRLVAVTANPQHARNRVHVRPVPARTAEFVGEFGDPDEFGGAAAGFPG